VKFEKGSPIREGKAKILYEVRSADPKSTGDFIIQYFKDDATAFNAEKRGQIKNKGIINNAISSWVFQYLEKKGIPTHFSEKLSEREMLVRRVKIIPIEMVVRNRATGSITKRLGIAKGTPFQPPLVEFFYKSDELGDPLIGETHIFHFKWASREELSGMVRTSLQVNEELRSLFDEVGLELIDFKLEFGRDNDQKILNQEYFYIYAK